MFAGLFVLVIGSRESDPVDTAPSTTPSAPKTTPIAKKTDQDKPESEPRSVDEMLASIEKQIDSHRFSDALLALNNLSRNDLKSSQIERFDEFDERANHGESIQKGLRRAIRRNPGRLAELIEGRFRKILKADNQGIQFVRPDLPSAQKSSMAWGQISPQGMIALLDAFELVRTHPVEVRSYLREHDHVIQDGQILSRSEANARTSRLAKREKSEEENLDRASIREADSNKRKATTEKSFKYDTGDEVLRIGRDREKDELARKPVEKENKEEDNKPARVENRKEKEDKASVMKRRGFVQHRGRWVTKTQKRILEDMVDPADSENVKTFAEERMYISRPANSRWTFGSVRTPQALFTLQKRSEGETKVLITCYRYLFDYNYSFPGQFPIDGSNPTGLLKGHVVNLENQHRGIKVRKRMWKDHFHREMTPFRTVLRKKDGTHFEIVSVPSSQSYADRTFVLVVEYSAGEYEYARHGVESIMKSFHVTDRGDNSSGTAVNANNPGEDAAKKKKKIRRVPLRRSN